MALLGAGLLIAITRVTTETALQDVEWATLAFFMGLFIMVGGLVESGVLEALAHSVAGFAGERPARVHRRSCCGAPECSPESSTTSPTSPA